MACTMQHEEFMESTQVESVLGKVLFLESSFIFSFF